MTMKKPARLKLKTAAKRKTVKKKTTAKKGMSEAEMMQAWHKAATPADGHKRLEPMVGTFKTRVTFVMGPGAPPNVGEGMSEHRWVLGGRYVEQRYNGDSMGMPFEGLGYTGYDNAQRKYVGTWMDTFGTGIMNSVGVGKPTAKEIKFDSVAIEPSGKPIRFDCVVRIKDRDRHSFEMWTKAPNGKKFRTMLAEYERS